MSQQIRRRYETSSRGEDAELSSDEKKAPLPTSSSSASDDELMRAVEPHLPWLLLALALATRFYRLDVPRGVVFDEYHFGRFVNQYNAGTYLFDIHPPLGKLVFVFVGHLFGYDHRNCQYNNIQVRFFSLAFLVPLCRQLLTQDFSVCTLPSPNRTSTSPSASLWFCA